MVSHVHILHFMISWQWGDELYLYLWREDIRSNQWFVGKLRKCKGKRMCNLQISLLAQ